MYNIHISEMHWESMVSDDACPVQGGGLVRRTDRATAAMTMCTYDVYLDS